MTAAPEGTQGHHACPTCGLEGEPAGTFGIVNFDDDLEGARKLLGGRPLATRCTNCGTVYDSIEGFVFVSPKDRFVVMRVPPEAVEPARAQAESQAETPLETLIVSSDADECVAAVRSYLGELANEVLVPLQLAIAEKTLSEWAEGAGRTVSRRAVSAAALIAPIAGAPTVAAGGPADDQEAADASRAHLERVLDTLLAARLQLAVREAFERKSQVFEALDDAVSPANVNERVLAHLSYGAGHLPTNRARLEAAVPLAWWSERSGENLPPDVASAWAQWALVWATAPEELPPLVIGDEILRRTVNSVAAIDAIAAMWGDDLGARMAQVAIEKRVLTPLELWKRIRFGATPEENRDHHLRFARSLPVEQTDDAIDLLSAHGLLDDAVTVYQERLAELVRTDPGAGATKMLVQVLWHAHRVNAAADVAAEFLERSGPDTEKWLSPDRTVDLMNEIGNVARQLGDREWALTAYEAALGALRRSEAASSQRPVVQRNVAIIYREVGRPAEARNLLLQLLEVELEPRARSQLLDSLGLCLLALGELESAATAFEDGLVVLEPLAAAFPAERLNLMLEGAQAAAALNDHGKSASLAGEAHSSAQALGDRYLSAAAATIRARAAASGGADDAPGLASVAFEEITRAHAALAENELHLAGLRRMEVGLLEDAGDVERLVNLVDAEQAPSWEMLAVTGRAVATAAGWRAARPYLNRAWSKLLSSLAGDELAPTDIAVLRNAKGLQMATAEAGLEVLRQKGSGLDALPATELNAGLVGGLLSWPVEQRAQAVELLHDPERLLGDLAYAGTVVFGLEGLERSAMVALVDDRSYVLGEWDSNEVDRTTAEIGAAARRSGPSGDPLAKSPRWRRFAADLGGALAPLIEEGRMVLLVPGPAFGGLPLHATAVGGRALCRRTPCAYTPSLLQLAGLGTRWGEGAHGGPAIPTVGAIAAPRVRDREEVKRAFADSVDRVCRIAEMHGLATHRRVDTDATVDQFEHLCGSVSLLFLACHGLAQPGYGKHGLLLAHAGQLPPMLVETEDADALAQRFLLSWNEIAPPTPPVVVSAACSSGSASFAHGGERVSLDRAFLTASTQLFIGPLWDVSAQDGQDLAVSLVASSLSGAPTWADAWLDVVDDASDTLPPASWQSFIVQGDWRI